MSGVADAESGTRNAHAGIPGIPRATILADADRLAAIALAEDGGRDITTEVTAASGERARGRIEYRTGGVVAGLDWASAMARAAHCTIHWFAADGDRASADSVIGELDGTFADVLRAERPLLNVLQRSCGIANATANYVDAVRGTPCRILHTRKTPPGLRLLDLAAVLAGGGTLHRFDLSHTVMIKDNHWQALARSGRTLAEALNAARARGITGLQVEVESLAQVENASAAGATRLLVDNQQPDTVREWAGMARVIRPGIEIEATGGITIDNARRYAEAGSDFISIGGLTHSVRAADVGLEIAASEK